MHAPADPQQFLARPGRLRPLPRLRHHNHRSRDGGRSCFGLEIAPAYCDVIVKRWQDFTGSAATLDGDGRSFAEIDAERFRIGETHRNSAACYDEAIAAKRLHVGSRG
jgi:hypothetical protein